MRFYLGFIAVMLAGAGFCSALAGAENATANIAAETAPGVSAVRPAVERALTFLQKDAVKWKEEHQCATCHHGALTVWTLHDAKAFGYPIEERDLTDAVEWSKKKFIHPFDAEKDLKPHYICMPMAPVMMTFGAETSGLPGLTPADFDTIAVHLTRRQAADGAWLAPPPANGPVPFFESQETLTLWAYLALERYVPADPQTPSPARDSREKAAAWLAKTPIADTTQAAVLRLLVEVRADGSAEQWRPALDRLLARQDADGGWSQTKDLASDAFATGQALWVLKLAGVDRREPEMQRAIAFLLKTQREDGSWPMIPRETPQRKASKNTQPIIYFGSAWATLGLLQATPE